MPFPQSFLDELIARNDIVDVVGSYVSLTPKGGSFWGCCPFHNEKTPSFHVLPDKQFYHCFGCKKGGGVINFVMDIENLSYPDAVRFLAKRANIPVPEEASDGTEKLRRRMLELNRDAVQDAIGNARHNGVKNARFFAADATRWISEAAAAGERADVIFMDPPYDQEQERRVLEQLRYAKYVSEETLILVEASLHTDFSYAEDLGFEVIREKKYKTNKHVFLRKK